MNKITDIKKNVPPPMIRKAPIIVLIVSFSYSEFSSKSEEKTIIQNTIVDKSMIIPLITLSKPVVFAKLIAFICFPNVS